jgi:hypothetical protein
MNRPALIWMVLFVVAVAATAHLARISVSPSSNAAIFYVTDRWTGTVFFCTAGSSGYCLRSFSATNSN